MERIDPFGAAVFNTQHKESKKVKKKSLFKTGFSSLISSVESDEEGDFLTLDQAGEKKSLESFLDEIHELGDKLKENPTLSRVQAYKTAVRNFVRYIVKYNFVVEKQRLSGFKVLKRKGQPELTLIKIIDKKLDQLAAGVLQNQKEQLEILRRINEIEGLLVDLIR
ncbi:MAG: YaaR family protein [Spirochaetota bacterium]